VQVTKKQIDEIKDKEVVKQAAKVLREFDLLDIEYQKMIVNYYNMTLEADKKQDMIEEAEKISEYTTNITKKLVLQPPTEKELFEDDESNKVRILKELNAKRKKRRKNADKGN